MFPFQRQAKYTENKLKAIKARNEYLLALEATNASVFKYYIHDLSDLIDVSAESGVLGASFLAAEVWPGVPSSVAQASQSTVRTVMKEVAMSHQGLAVYQVPGEALYTLSPSVLTRILKGNHYNSESSDDLPRVSD